MSLDKIPFQAEEIKIRQIFRSGELDTAIRIPQCLQRRLELCMAVN